MEHSITLGLAQSRIPVQGQGVHTIQLGLAQFRIPVQGQGVHSITPCLTQSGIPVQDQGVHSFQLGLAHSEILVQDQGVQSFQVGLAQSGIFVQGQGDQSIQLHLTQSGIRPRSRSPLNPAISHPVQDPSTRSACKSPAVSHSVPRGKSPAVSQFGKLYYLEITYKYLTLSYVFKSSACAYAWSEFSKYALEIYVHENSTS